MSDIPEDETTAPEDLNPYHIAQTQFDRGSAYSPVRVAAATLERGIWP